VRALDGHDRAGDEGRLAKAGEHCFEQTPLMPR
jgi:hypothetical protein